MQRRDGFCVKLCWRAGLFASSFVGGSSGCTTHNGAVNGCYYGGGYCDQSNTCYRCNYITPTLCDAFDNDCCSSEFLSQCPGDPHGCKTQCVFQDNTCPAALVTIVQLGVTNLVMPVVGGTHVVVCIVQRAVIFAPVATQCPLIADCALPTRVEPDNGGAEDCVLTRVAAEIL
jgi:hypothetical protein